MKRVFSWLHISDLHLGMSHKGLWQQVKQRFFEDLESVHRQCGHWDVVFFTGDLVFSGKKSEFKSLTKELNELWDVIRKLQPSRPKLISVPGNHDLSRPLTKDLRVSNLISLNNSEQIIQSLWDADEHGFREIFKNSFKEYVNWLNTCNLKHPQLKIGRTIIPGDFSLRLQKKPDNLKIGVVGLNSAFLQLSGGDFKKKLTLDVRQLHSVCGDDAAKWLSQNHLNILLTHHPPDWLKNEKDFQREILGSGFSIHLFGHMHEPYSKHGSDFDGPIRAIRQGASLFGLEDYVNSRGQHKTRIHGYQAGLLLLDNEQMKARFWPRTIKESGGRWQFVRDNRFSLLEGDGGTKATAISYNQKLLHPALKGEISFEPTAHTEHPDAPKAGAVISVDNSYRPAAYRTLRERAEKTIFVVGIGMGNISSNLESLEKLLKRGVNVRLLSFDPKNLKRSEARRDFEAAYYPKDIAAIEKAYSVLINFVQNEAKGLKGKIESRRYTEIQTINMTCIDEGNVKKRKMILELSTYKNHRVRMHLYGLHPASDPIIKAMEDLWKTSKDSSITNKPKRRKSS